VTTLYILIEEDRKAHLSVRAILYLGMLSANTINCLYNSRLDQ